MLEQPISSCSSPSFYLFIFYHRLKRVTMWKTGFLIKNKIKKTCWNTNTYQESLCTLSSNAEQERGTSQLNVAMCDDHPRSDGLNGIWLKSVDSQLSPSFFHTSYTAHTCTQRCTNPVYLACWEQQNYMNVFYFELFHLSWCDCKAGGGLEVNWAAVVVEVKSTCVFGWPKGEEKKKACHCLSSHGKSN